MVTTMTQEAAQFASWLLGMLTAASQTAEMKQDHLSSACWTPALHRLSSAQLSSAQLSSAQLSSAQPSPAQPSPAQPSPAQPSPAQPSPAQLSSAQLRRPDCLKSFKGQTYLVDRILPTTTSSVPAAAEEEEEEEEEEAAATGPDEVDVTADTP